MTLLSSPLQAVIDVFSGPLNGVRFADIDGDGLGTLASEVESLGSDVEVQEAQLASLREVLAQKQEALLSLAQQALAYARIYAESDETLSAELNEITLPRAAKPRKSASVKAPSERAKASKDQEDNVTDGEAELQTQADEVVEAKAKRKAAVANGAAKSLPVEPSEEEVVVAAKGRRKLPTKKR